MSNGRESALVIAEFGMACLQKVRVLGAVSQTVGFACVQALGAMECAEAISQLRRLRAKVKYSVARRLIEKSLQEAAERSGLTVDELEDISVGSYELDAQGVAEIVIEDTEATVRVGEDGRVALFWHNAEGKMAKSAPSHIRKAFPQKVRSVASLVNELEQAYLAQRTRLESSFFWPRGVPMTHWRQHFIEHSLLGLLGGTGEAGLELPQAKVARLSVHLGTYGPSKPGEPLFLRIPMQPSGPFPRKPCDQRAMGALRLSIKE
jgi:hypothetical protein